MRRVHVFACLLAFGFLGLLLDVPISLFLDSNDFPRDLEKLFKLAEVGAHGVGAAMFILALLSILKISLSKWQDQIFILKVIIGVYAGGLITNVLKILIPRVRPKVASLAFDTNSIQTFGSSLLESSNNSVSHLMSFPSGHAAVAASVAVLVCRAYPPSIPAATTLAILACAQRVVSLNHYVSDVFFGSAIGFGLSCLIIPPHIEFAKRFKYLSAEKSNT